MYAAHGYEEIEPYDGHGKADHWYAKPLRRTERRAATGRDEEVGRGPHPVHLGPLLALQR